MIIFRTDDIPGHDRGTLPRTSYLALMLRKQISVCILVDKKVGFAHGLIRKNISVKTLDTLDKSDNIKLKSVVFDVNEFSEDDRELLKWAKEGNIQTVQFTDLGLNSQAMNFFIDSSLEMITPYPRNTNGLLGPRYAVVHTKFRHFNLARKKIRKQPKNVFLNPGKDMTYRQLRNLTDELIRHGFNVKVNPGPMLRKSHKKILKRIYPQIKFVGKVDSLARSFFESDVALIQAGAAAYEAAACGTPALYFCSSPHEEFIAGTFEKNDIGMKADYSPDRTDNRIGEQIKSLDFGQREMMGARGRETVDGLGIFRIIDFFRKNNII
jgi:spore coat polysaccharide biosynthesis predicted glycosyltransferase SpsG